MQEPGHLYRHHPAVGELGKGDIGERVLANRDRRTITEPEPDRMQPEAVAKSEGHHRVGVVERPGRRDGLAEEADRVDEFRVGVGDRWPLLAPAVAVLHDHRVAAVDLDVLRLGNLEQRLEPAKTEDGILDRLRIGLLDRDRPQGLTVGAQPVDVVTNHLLDDRASEQATIHVGHRALLPGDGRRDPL